MVITASQIGATLAFGLNTVIDDEYERCRD